MECLMSVSGYLRNGLSACSSSSSASVLDLA